MSLGVKLKELRLNEGTSLQAVADAVGVSKPHIWELERGTTKNPSQNLVKQLADYFGQTVEYLITDDAEKLNDQHSFARKIDVMDLSETDIEALLAAAKILSNK